MSAWIRTLSRCLALNVVSLFSGAVIAEDARLGLLTIVSPHVRAAPPAARVGAGYLVIRNGGDTPDRLLSVTSTAVKSVEIHRSSTEGGVARMRHLPEGVVLPAQSETKLAPGGLHLMLMEPMAPLDAGRVIDVTLVFEKAGSVAVRFEVRSAAR